MFKQFGSQTVEVSEFSLITHINEPFMIAGKVFGWKGRTPGIGLQDNIVNFAAEHDLVIIFTVGENKKRYRYLGKDWKQICEDNKWLYTVSNGTIVYVLPWDKVTVLEG
jgi:hypothetical protein